MIAVRLLVRVPGSNQNTPFAPGFQQRGQRISDATQAQTGTARQIADNMREILVVTDQSSEGARRSAKSIGQLSVLSDDLKVSVSGFKL